MYIPTGCKTQAIQLVKRAKQTLLPYKQYLSIGSSRDGCPPILLVSRNLGSQRICQFQKNYSVLYLFVIPPNWQVCTLKRSVKGLQRAQKFINQHLKKNLE